MGMNIAIIGLGFIGNAVLKEISKKLSNKDKIIGIDINRKKVKKLKKLGYNTTTNLENPQDVYIICVYNTKQVRSVIKKIDYSKRPLVSIESTIKPQSYKEFTGIIVNKNKSNFILFPHRIYSYDKKHHVFNLNRVMAGATKKCLERGLNFYKKFMPKKHIIITTLEYAELSKIVENAYRFIEIAIAEEVKMFCDKNGLDFKKLRKCINTKWNMDMKEARNGIKRGCLPKDIKLLNDYFKNNLLFDSAIKLDKKYRNVRNFPPV